MMFKRFLNRLRVRAGGSRPAPASKYHRDDKPVQRAIHLTTCVWGDQHLDVMKKVMWPTLLSENNLPYLASHLKAKYRISTTIRDHTSIIDWPIFHRIAALVEVEWDLLPEAPPIEYHVEWYERSLRVAREADALCALIYSDVAWCDGMFRRCVQAIAEGKIGITSPYIRTISETCLPEMAAMAERDGILKLDRKELVRIGIRHIHPITAAANVNGRHARPSLEAIWRVPDQGILLRQMVHETFFIDPTKLQTSRQWYPAHCKIEDLHIGSATDDILILSFAHLFKDVENFIPDHSLSSLDLAQMSLHPVNDTSVASDIARVPIYLSYGDTNSRDWEKHLADSNEFISQSIKLRGCLRVWQCAQEAGCIRAARLIGAALHVTGIVEEWRDERGVTVVVPDDKAFESSEELQDRAIVDCGWDYLKHLLLRHTIVNDLIFPQAGLATTQNALDEPLLIECDGKGDARIGGALILRIVEIHPHRLLIVDKCVSKLSNEDLKLTKKSEGLGRYIISPKVLQHIDHPPISIDQHDLLISEGYMSFLREFEVDLGGRDIDHVRRNAASAFLQAGQIRHQASLLSEIMDDFRRDGGETDPASAFSAALLCVVGEHDRLLESSQLFYELSLRIEPNSAEACYGLAVIKSRMGHYDEARQLFARAITSRCHPKSRDGGTISGRSDRENAIIELKLQNYESAAVYFDRSFSKLTSFGAYNVDYADFLAAIGCINEAVDQYYRASYYSNLLTSELISPIFSFDERLPNTGNGLILNPLNVTKIGHLAQEDLYYWWHIYMIIPADLGLSNSSDILAFRRSGGRLRCAVSAELLTERRVA